jgi:hypothetical protein
MGVDSLGELHAWVEMLISVVDEACLTNFKASFDQFDVSVLQGVIDDLLVFLDRDGTG